MLSQHWFVISDFLMGPMRQVTRLLPTIQSCKCCIRKRSCLLPCTHGKSQVALVVKNPPVNARDARDTGSIPGWGRSLGEGNGNPPVFLPGESHRQRSLVGYSPWGHRVRHEWSDLARSMHAHRDSVLRAVRKFPHFPCHSSETTFSGCKLSQVRMMGSGLPWWSSG